jgi:hypothetical protein
MYQMRESHLRISKATVFPQLGVVEEIALLFSHATQQLVQACAIIELIQQTDKKVNVASRVNEMPSWAFEFWSPNLDRKGFGENLGKFLLGSQGSSCVLLLVVKDMCSLGLGKLAEYQKKSIRMRHTLTLMR